MTERQYRARERKAVKQWREDMRWKRLESLLMAFYELYASGADCGSAGCEVWVSTGVKRRK